MKNAVILALLSVGYGSGALADETKEGTVSEVCAAEKQALTGYHDRYLPLHPALARATARTTAACQPAPSADCARARSKLADLAIVYLDRHPKFVAAKNAVDRSCSQPLRRSSADLVVATKD